MQNLVHKLNGIRGRGLKALWKWTTKLFVLIFGIYYVALKLITYAMSYIGYASLVKILRFICAHLGSFQFI